jgi:outer membrane receptor for ferrienterochelin and colicins
MRKIFKMAMALFVLVSFFALPGAGLTEEYTSGKEVKKEEKEKPKEEANGEEKEAVNLETTIVTATKTKYALGDVPGSVSVITKEDIEAANIESAADALRWVTGVRLKKGGWRGRNPYSVTANLLGLPGEYTLVLVNGQRVIGGGTDGSLTPQSVDLAQFPAEIIERIEVVKGAGSSIYGSQAVAGVINIITKSPSKKPSFFASASLGSRDTGIYKASHGLTIDKFGYYLNYTRKEADGLDSGSENNSDNVFARLSYDFTPSVKLTIEPRYYQQDNKYSYSGRSGIGNYEEESETRGLNSILDWRPDESSKFKIRLSGDEYNQKREGGAIGRPAQKEEQDNDRYETELSYTRPFFKNNIITLGYQHSKEKYKYPHYKIDKDQTLNAGFIQDEIHFNPFTVTLAGRVDDYDRLGTFFCPRAGLSYQATENLTFGGSMGKTFKIPTFRELYQDGWIMGSRTWMFGNPDLNPEESIGYQAGVEYRDKNLLMQCSLFRNDIKDMIEWDRNYIPNDMGPGTRAWKTRNISKAYTQGIEFNLGMIFTNNLKGSLGYAFLDSENEETGTDLAYTPDHKLNAELDYKGSKYLPHINLRGEYVGKRYTSTDRSKREQEDDYILVHIKFSKTFFKRFNTFLSIDNIFDTNYDEESEMPGREFLAGVSVKF